MRLNYCFDRLRHECLKGFELLVKNFGDCKVDESQLFCDFILVGGLEFFLEGIIVSFDYLDKIIMIEIRYNGGFFV